MKILAVYVGTSGISRNNLEHGLTAGIWGFKESVKPELFGSLAPGDTIVLASGYSGGSPRAPFPEWKGHSVATIYYARVSSAPFMSLEPEWPDEGALDKEQRYCHRIRFDPSTLKQLKNVKLDDDSILSPNLSELIRSSGCANGRGYVTDANEFPPALGVLESKPQGVPNPVFSNECLQEFIKAAKAVHFRIGDDFVARFAASLIAKPFAILTGNSGTGKTKLAELFVQWLCRGSLDHFALVSVGADWTDSRNVLGFVNHLRTVNVNEAGSDIPLPIYQTTKILDLLLEAGRKENEEKPFFLILDEMNLSHVERYFADFLSTMESKEGRLLLHREGRALPRKQGGLCDVPEAIALPRNVFVIGTVNVDETTYMFSPKVLDRANVIEFRVEQDAPVAFLKSGGRSIGKVAHSSAEYAESFLELSLRARSLKGAALALAVDPDVPPPGAKEGIGKCRDAITDIFVLMQKRHQEFAFRTMAEVLRFLAVDYELKPAEQAWNWSGALDAQILQKILPKLHGSKRKIGSLLAALAKYCEQGIRPDAETLLMDETKAEAYLASHDKREKSPMFRGSYIKLCEMMEAVRRDQFVSFIQ
jgi:5-methylcytosine-specific restriction protein B